MLSFSHNKEGWTKRGTIAVNTPSKTDLEFMFSQHATCTLILIGAARLAEGAQFVKKEGREYAQSLMTICKANLKNVEIRGTRHVYHFIVECPSRVREDKGVQTVRLGISTVKEHENSHLVYAYFEDEFDRLEMGK